jgi:hypothetical protein
MRVPSPGRAGGYGADRFVQATRRALAAVASAAAVAAPVSASNAAPAPTARGATAGSIGVRLLDVPVTAYDDPRARLYIIDHLHPGTNIQRRIEISNTTVSTVHVVIYSAAATVSQGLFIGAAAHTPNELSTWTSVVPAESDVPPGRLATAAVTITVPRNAAPTERYGVVWVETRSAPSVGGGITQVSRVGIRLYISVGPGGPPASNFTIDSLSAKRSPDGRPVVVATVHNTGGRALDMNGTLQLSAGPGGLSAGPFPANLGETLAIGDTEPITITFDRRLPAGPWDALVTLHSGLLERSARATITFPVPGAPPSPWLTIAGIVIILLMSAAAARLITGRRRQSTLVGSLARRPS